MRHDTIGRTMRALRHRRGMRQRDLARRSGVSRSVVSDLERGVIETHTLRALARTVSAAGASLRIEVVVPGHDLRRLLDADHARIQSAWAEMLGRWGWDVEAEVTFNHFGERGSIDLLAWHEPSRIVLVVEIKTLIVDVQHLLAGLHRKVRLGARNPGGRPPGGSDSAGARRGRGNDGAASHHRPRSAVRPPRAAWSECFGMAAGSRRVFAAAGNSLPD